MDASEFAKMLDGRKYRNEITEEEIELAEDNHLLVVFGASDDLALLHGFENDEVGCNDGGYFEVDVNGLRREWPAGDEKDYEDAKEYFRRESQPSIRINAQWNVRENVSWTYEVVEEPSELDVTRFSVLEDGEVYCIGIVVDMKPIIGG